MFTWCEFFSFKLYDKNILMRQLLLHSLQIFKIAKFIKHQWNNRINVAYIMNVYKEKSKLKIRTHFLRGRVGARERKREKERKRECTLVRVNHKSPIFRVFLNLSIFLLSFAQLQYFIKLFKTFTRKSTVQCFFVNLYILYTCICIFFIMMMGKILNT